MLDRQRGCCFSLTALGAEVWELIDQTGSVSDICAVISRKYSMPADIVERDVRKFIDDLMEKSLVELY